MLPAVRGAQRVDDEAGRTPAAGMGAAQEGGEREWGPADSGDGRVARASRRVQAGPQCCVFPLALQTISHSSDALQRYCAVRSVEILRAEQWRVFCSRRPMRQMFRLRWVCAFVMFLGLLALLRAPKGLLRFSWIQEVHKASTRQAKMMRFTPLARRDGEKPGSVAEWVEFGPLFRGCRLNQSHVGTVSHTAQDSTISFPSSVDFDGWYFKSGREAAQLDPTSYVVHYSTDGATWELLIDSSQGPQCPCYLNRDRDHDRAQHAPIMAASFPLERSKVVLNPFYSTSCMWPYYVIVVASNFFGATALAAGLLGLGQCYAATVPVIAWGAIVAAAIKVAGLARLVTSNMPLPFGPVEYSKTSLGIEILLEIFVFPGPLVWMEEHAFERALVGTCLETIVYLTLFPNSGYTLRGPVTFVLCAYILGIRERQRRKGLRAVQADRQLFDGAWERILGEGASREHLARLQQFGTSHREGAGAVQASMASSQRSSWWQRWQQSGSGSLLPGREASRASATNLFIAERSPNFTQSTSKALETPANLLAFDQIYSQATVMDPIFRQRVEALAARCRAYVLLEQHAQQGPGAHEPIALWSEMDADPAARARVSWAAIKPVDHAVRKSMLRHGRDQAPLPDLVRQRLIFASLGDICACLDAISTNPDLRIEAIKNGFDERLDARRNAGYRQVVVLLRVVTEHTQMLGVSSLTCELQLAHWEMLKLATPEQHARYLTYRSVMDFASLDRFASAGCWTLPTVGSTPPLRSEVDLHLRHAAPDEETGTALTAPVQAVQHLMAENVDPHIAELVAAGPKLHEVLSDRVYEVLRVRCHVPGTLLQSIIDELNQGLKKTHFSMMFFVRPLSMLLSPAGQLLLLLAGAYFMWLFFSSNLFSEHYDVRLVRLRVLETRAGSPGRRAAGGGVGISHLTVLRHQCAISSHNVSGLLDTVADSSAQAVTVGGHVQMRDDSLLLTLPQYVEMDGWSMSSALEQGSENRDPVRFELSHAQIDPSRYSFADCLRGNQWQSDAQIAAMSDESRRGAVVEELVKQHGNWCASSGPLRTCDELDDAELLRMCLPAAGVVEADWRMISASACRWGVYEIHCLPQPDQKFEYVSLSRGVTHVFNLSPPWFIVLGVVATYPLIFGFLILSALFGCLATLQSLNFGFARALLQTARGCLACSFILSGILELITALAIVTAPRTAAVNINRWDSFYWWPLSLMSLLFGIIIGLSEELIVPFPPFPFLISLPALFINNWLVLRNFDLPVPYSSVMVLSVWVVAHLLRYYYFRLARQAIAPDAEAYDSVWRAIVTNAENQSRLQELHEVAARQMTHGRPQQTMRPGGARGKPSEAASAVPLPGASTGVHLYAPSSSPEAAAASDGQAGSGRCPDAAGSRVSPLTGSSVSGEVAEDCRRPTFWPAKLVQTRSAWALACCSAGCHGPEKRLDPGTVPVSSLDTLYMQACLLEPIFSLKVQEIAMSAGGLFLSREDGAEDDMRFVAASVWSCQSDLKSVDRAIEKVTRVYNGHVPSILDVVRQCIVFERLEDLVSAMRVIEQVGGRVRACVRACVCVGGLVGILLACLPDRCIHTAAWVDR